MACLFPESGIDGGATRQAQPTQQGGWIYKYLIRPAEPGRPLAAPVRNVGDKNVPFPAQLVHALIIRNAQGDFFFFFRKRSERTCLLFLYRCQTDEDKEPLSPPRLRS